MREIDPRIRRGLIRQLELRAQGLSNGQTPIGWKAGFGSAAAMEKFDLDGPVIGFLTDASLLPSGGQIDLAGWTRPVAEPELAVRLGHDLAQDATEESAREAIVSVGPAIELADVHPPPEDVEEVVAGNVYHRALMLGVPDLGRPGADLAGLTALVRVNNRIVGETDQLEDLTGRVTAVVTRIARLLGSQGERLRAGEVIICGSVVPPVELAGGDDFEFELTPLPPLAITAIQQGMG